MCGLSAAGAVSWVHPTTALAGAWEDTITLKVQYDLNAFLIDPQVSARSLATILEDLKVGGWRYMRNFQNPVCLEIALSTALSSGALWCLLCDHCLRWPGESANVQAQDVTEFSGDEQVRHPKSVGLVRFFSEDRTPSQMEG